MAVRGNRRRCGPDFDSEFLVFNQAKRAPIPERTKEWFRSTRLSPRSITGDSAWPISAA